MASRWHFGIAAAGLMAAAGAPDAAAQGVNYWPPPTQPVLVAPTVMPPQSPPVSVTRTERSIDANGFVTSRIETYERQDAVGQGYGTLSAVSNSATHWTTTVAPSTVQIMTVAPVAPGMVAISPWTTSTRDEVTDIRR